jgi:hypothetical protein
MMAEPRTGDKPAQKKSWRTWFNNETFLNFYQCLLILQFPYTFQYTLTSGLSSKQMQWWALLKSFYQKKLLIVACTKLSKDAQGLTLAILTGVLAYK